MYVSSVCKMCTRNNPDKRSYDIEYRAKNAVKIKASKLDPIYKAKRCIRQREQHCVDMVRRAHRLFMAARARAKKRSLPMTITRKWIEERLARNQCEVTGLCFRYDAPDSRWTPYTPTLDRRVPSLGYTPENAQLVIWGYNALKGIATEDDACAIATALVYARHQPDLAPTPGGAKLVWS